MKLFILLYADDLGIVSDNADNLQVGLNALKAYSDKWKLKVNCKKTKITVFGKSKHCTNFVYEGSIIDCTSTFTYLGVVL